MTKLRSIRSTLVILITLSSTLVNLPNSAVFGATDRRGARTSRQADTQELIVRLKDGLLPNPTTSEFCQKYGLIEDQAPSASHPAIPRTAKPFGVTIPDTQNSNEVLEALNADPRVEYAEVRQSIPIEPLRLVELGPQAVSPATLREYQWALRRIEVADGLALSKVRVGIVDTGCDEGVANTVMGGRDFFKDSPDYSASFGHGNQMAAEWADPDFGILTYAQIYALKCSNADGNIDILAFSRAVDWAADKGIQVLSCSFGANGPGFAPSQTKLRALETAQDAGILVIGAAGNDGKNIDVDDSTWNVPYESVIRVAASSETDQRANFSAFGHGRVEVFAPGTNIIVSTNAIASGTSCSVPFVGALAGLLLEQGLSWQEVIERIESSVDRCQDLTDKAFTGGRLNYRRALAADLNKPLDELKIATLKIKKKKKLNLVERIGDFDSNPGGYLV